MALEFFPELENWQKSIAGGAFIGPFYTTQIDPLYLWDKGYSHDEIHRVASLTYVGVLVSKWLLENGDDCKFWYFGRANKKEIAPSFLIISDKEVFHKLCHWYNDNAVGARKNYQLFKDRESFLKTVSDSGQMTIQGKVPYKLESWNQNKSVNKACFDLWCWLENNVNHNYWYWDQTFYFENHDDAMLFKLTWYKEGEKKVT
jgi:hypothetical protein